MVTIFVVSGAVTYYYYFLDKASRSSLSKHLLNVLFGARAQSAQAGRNFCAALLLTTGQLVFLDPPGLVPKSTLRPLVVQGLF